MPSQPPKAVRVPADWAASSASHRAPMLLASSTFFARPTVNRWAPAANADAVGKAGNIPDLLGLYPLALLGNGSRTVISALGDRTHMLYFRRVDHSDDVPFCVIVVPCGG